MLPFPFRRVDPSLLLWLLRLLFRDKHAARFVLHAAKNFESQLIGYVIGSEVKGQLTVPDVPSVCHTNPAGPILELAGDVVSE